MLTFGKKLNSHIFRATIFPSFCTAKYSCRDEDDQKKCKHDSYDKNDDWRKSVVYWLADSISESPKNEKKLVVVTDLYIILLIDCPDHA